MFKNIALDKKKVENFFEEGVGFGITYHGENDEGRCVLSAKFKDPKIEEEKNNLIEGKFNDSPEEIFRHYQFRADDVSYSVERITDKGFVKESYYQPRSEEEKKQIIERNKKKREEEKRQKEISIAAVQDKEKESIDLNELTREINQKNAHIEISPNSDNKGQKLEQETSRASSFQNKDVY